MYKNYLYLFRLVLELKNIIKDKLVLDCFTQEKDKLFIHLVDKSNENNFLVIDTNNLFITIKTNFKKAKKNVISFFDDFIESKILDINIVFNERIIKLDTNKGFLIISLTGKNSNCYYLFNEKIFPFKKTDDTFLNNFYSEFQNKILINSFNDYIKKIKSLSFEEIYNLPFISKHVKEKIKSFNSIDYFLNLVEEIIYEKIAVGINNSKNELIFSPLSLINQNDETEVELFDSYIEAVEKYFQIEFKSDSYNSIKKMLVKNINNELERISNKLNNLKSRIENGSREKEYNHHGELLLSNINLIKKGMKEIQVFDWLYDKETTIKLDPKLSPQQNINYYFDKSRSEKVDYEKSNQIFNETKNKYDLLVNLKNEIENEITFERLNEIKNELKIKSNQKMNEEKKEKLPFRHFLIQDKYHFYIGRDSKSNDLLTTKFAKQNDYWFHARSVAGSHGVLRVENTKEAIPKNILEKAASITAFYSKAKTSKLASVTYTLKKYVVKNSKHEPGQVSVLKEKVLLVKPEIPDDCVYIED
ncbi:MAG: NFACT RNA binding domain-containing protein [Melioribacteraceae bacterium]|nr:NFACT RNA binding domain-containing protein [Melioribacteraceae bacterium]